MGIKLTSVVVVKQTSIDHEYKETSELRTLMSNRNRVMLSLIESSFRSCNSVFCSSYVEFLCIGQEVSFPMYVSYIMGIFFS